jgi:guanylate kinase
MLNKIAEPEEQTRRVAATDEMGRGILFVVSSPSGGGKGTLVQRVRKTVQNLSYSVSYTTRTPRQGEVDGREYCFVPEAQFDEMIAANAFLEWAHVHGKRYGTGKAQIAREIAQGKDIILEVDVQGAESVRRLIADAVSIFILPPSFEILRRRLVARGTDTSAELELRLRNAPAELKHYASFEYIIINDEAERAAAQLASIIYAERARLSRQEPYVKRVIETFTLDEKSTTN